MSTTTDLQLLQFLCDFEQEAGWDFKRYKSEILGKKDEPAEPSTIRDRLSKWKKMKHEDPNAFIELCRSYDLHPKNLFKSTPKAFIKDCGDLYFCQYTMDCDPADQRLQLYVTNDGYSVKLRFGKYIPQSAEERLNLGNLSHATTHFIYRNIEVEQEEHNRRLGRGDFEDDFALFHFGERCLAYFVDAEGNRSGYSRSKNPDGNAVLTFLVMKADRMFQKMTSPTRSMYQPGFSAAGHLGGMVIDPTRSTGHENQTSASTVTTATPKGATSIFGRLGISPLMQKTANMDVDMSENKSAENSVTNDVDMDELTQLVAKTVRIIMDKQGK